jgi:rod shape-determining protein MreD
VSAGRFAAFMALSYVSLVLLAALTSLLPGSLRAALPELTLILVLYLGLTGAPGGNATERGSTTVFVVFALMVGYLTDLFSGAPRGLHAFTLGLVMVLARSAQSRLLVTRAWQEMVVSALASAAHGALVVGLSSPGGDEDGFAPLSQVPLTAVVTALAAPIAFALFRRIDKKRLSVPGALRMS